MSFFHTYIQRPSIHITLDDRWGHWVVIECASDSKEEALARLEDLGFPRDNWTHRGDTVILTIIGYEPKKFFQIYEWCDWSERPRKEEWVIHVYYLDGSHEQITRATDEPK